jgi:hypothetical protein
MPAGTFAGGGTEEDDASGTARLAKGREDAGYAEEASDWASFC